LSVRELGRRVRRLEASVPRPRHRPSELGGQALEAVDACIAQMLAPLPAPDSPDWTPAHHAVLAEAAALHRRRWAPSAGAEEGGHDLLADPAAVVEVARILREAGVA
jgi:hypothetical protein